MSSSESNSDPPPPYSAVMNPVNSVSYPDLSELQEVPGNEYYQAPPPSAPPSDEEQRIGSMLVEMKQEMAGLVENDRTLTKTLEGLSKYLDELKLNQGGGGGIAPQQPNFVFGDRTHLLQKPTEEEEEEDREEEEAEIQHDQEIQHELQIGKKHEQQQYYSSNQKSILRIPIAHSPSSDHHQGQGDSTASNLQQISLSERKPPALDRQIPGPKTDTLLSIEPAKASFLLMRNSLSHHKMINAGPVTLAVKVKCSNNDLYRLRPIFAVIKPGDHVDLTIARRAAPAQHLDKLVVQFLDTPQSDKRPVAPDNASLAGLFRAAVDRQSSLRQIVIPLMVTDVTKPPKSVDSAVESFTPTKSSPQNFELSRPVPTKLRPVLKSMNGGESKAAKILSVEEFEKESQRELRLPLPVEYSIQQQIPFSNRIQDENRNGADADADEEEKSLRAIRLPVPKDIKSCKEYFCIVNDGSYLDIWAKLNKPPPVQEEEKGEREKEGEEEEEEDEEGQAGWGTDSKLQEEKEALRLKLIKATVLPDECIFSKTWYELYQPDTPDCEDNKQSGDFSDGLPKLSSPTTPPVADSPRLSSCSYDASDSSILNLSANISNSNGANNSQTHQPPFEKVKSSVIKTTKKVKGAEKEMSNEFVFDV